MLSCPGSVTPKLYRELPTLQLTPTPAPPPPNLNWSTTLSLRPNYCGSFLTSLKPPLWSSHVRDPRGSLCHPPRPRGCPQGSQDIPLKCTQCHLQMLKSDCLYSNSTSSTHYCVTWGKGINTSTFMASSSVKQNHYPGTVNKANEQIQVTFLEKLWTLKWKPHEGRDCPLG